MQNEKIYTSMSSAKRGAVRARMIAPVFTKTADGKISVTEAPTKVRAGRVTVSTTTTPVAAFRKLFEQMYGKATRAEVLQKAIDAGIAKNTAATYYYKLAAELKAA